MYRVQNSYGCVLAIRLLVVRNIRHAVGAVVGFWKAGSSAPGQAVGFCVYGGFLKRMRPRNWAPGRWVMLVWSCQHLELSGWAQDQQPAGFHLMIGAATGLITCLRAMGNWHPMTRPSTLGWRPAAPAIPDVFMRSARPV